MTLSLNILAILISVACAAGAIHFVEPGQSIRLAVNGAADGDTVLIENGTYSDAVVIQNRQLVIGSRFLLDGNTAHIPLTMITPDDSDEDTGSVFFVSDSSQISLQGMTIENGTGTTLSDGRCGGGLCVSEATLALRYCTVVDCEATIGGGIYVYGEPGGPSTRLEAYRTIFQNCRSSTGGGLHSDSSILLIDSCEFVENDASQLGGGAYIEDSEISITETRFSSNAALHGAGVRLLDNTGILSGCRFENNGFDSTGISSHCHCSGSGLVISGNHFGESQAGIIGVFLYADQFDSIATFRGNVVEGVFTRHLTGSVTVYTGSGHLSHNIFRSNENIIGGAVHVANGAFVRLSRNVFEGNSSTIDSGGSVLQIAGINTVRLDSNWINGNFGTTISCNIFPQQCNVVRAENNWWGHASGPYHATLNPEGMGDTLVYSNVDFTPWLTQPPDCTSSVRETLPIPSTWQLLSVYPNPFNHTLQIEIAGFTLDDFEITLVDLLGREAAIIHRGRAVGGVLTFHAPTSLASGIYFVRAMDARFAETKKVVFLK